ncbi:unnamed protein product, partial [Adineta steineri]
MGILRHRYMRRQEAISNDDEMQQDTYEEDGDDDESSVSIPSSIDYLSTTTESPYDKAKTIGE